MPVLLNYFGGICLVEMVFDTATVAGATRGGEIVVPFPQFARGLHDFATYQAQLAARDLATETIEGLGLAGPEKWVKSLTGSLQLLR